MSRVKRAAKMIMLHKYDVENFNYGGEGRNLKERTNVLRGWSAKYRYVQELYT